MTTGTLDEVKKLVHDLKQKVEEKVTPKEQLLQMVTDTVGKQMQIHTRPQDQHRFDEIPEPRSLIKRFEIKGAEDILRAENTKTDFYGRPQMRFNPATGGRELMVKDERMAELQTAADDLAFVHAIMRVAGPAEYREMCQSGREAQAVRSLKSFRRFDRLTEGLKAELDSTTSGEGDEWVPTNFSRQLTDAIVLEHRVANLFPLIQMPTEPFTMPTQTAKPKASIVAEGAAPATATLGAGKPTTANKNLATKIFKYFLDFTDEVVEDSIIAIVPFVRRWTTLGLARGEETMIVNGDATGAHMDSDITDAEQPEKGQDGLRQFGSSDTVGITDPLAATEIRAIRLLLSVGFRENPNNLVYITSGLGLIRMMGITEILTIDKVGPQATIVQGQLAQFDGSPVIVSEHVREDLNASGVHDGAVTNRTIIIAAHVPSFVRGSRRDPRVEIDKTIKTSVTTMVASMRRGFLDVQDNATFDNVAIGVGLS